MKFSPQHSNNWAFVLHLGCTSFIKDPNPSKKQIHHTSPHKHPPSMVLLLWPQGIPSQHEVQTSNDDKPEPLPYTPKLAKKELPTLFDRTEHVLSPGKLCTHPSLLICLNRPCQHHCKDASAQIWLLFLVTAYEAHGATTRASA